MAEPFLFDAGCEPIDGAGHLTECFIANLDTGPIKANDLFNIAYSKIEPGLEADLKWVFKLAKSKAEEGLFKLNIPYIQSFKDFESSEHFRNQWELNNAQVVRNIDLKRNEVNMILNNENLEKYHVRYLKERGYIVNTYDTFRGLRITSISWDKE